MALIIDNISDVNLFANKTLNCSCLSFNDADCVTIRYMTQEGFKGRATPTKKAKGLNNIY